MDTISNPRPLSAEQQNMLSMWQQHMHAEFVLTQLKHWYQKN
jgi:hypothetical protein